MSDVAINVAGVSKIYKLYNKPSDRLKETLGMKVSVREHFALDEVSFSIGRGETVGIIGTNGSGKSTVLKIITGVLNPTAGSVAVDGRISALLELGAGFNMEYTGIENVYLNGTMIGFSREEIDKKLDAILDFADIGEFVNQPVKSYSSGMFVRLAFAVAINIDPEILIVDEALSVGDVFFQAKCYRKFEEFKKLGKTILFVSHDLGSITKYCDRTILLNKGKKIFEGTPKEAVDIYKKVLVNQFTPEELERDDTANEVEFPGGESASDAQAVGAKKESAGKRTGEGRHASVGEDGQSVPGQKGKQAKTTAATAKTVGSWKASLVQNPNLLEYGEKNAEIIDFAVWDDQDLITNTIIKGSRFTIGMRVRFAEPIAEPIFAFTIKNLQGIELTGTNTMFEKAEVPPENVGDVREVRFTQKMELQGGEYLISLGCTGYQDGDFRVYHRLYDICSLSVISDKNTTGYFDMESEVTVS